MAEAVAEVSTRIAAPRDEVWRALTDPDVSERYTLGGARIDTDWQVGHPITWSGEWNGQRFEDKGEILEFEPSRRMAYSHWSPMGGTPDAPENYHVVTIDLDGDDDSTTVSLTQSNASGDVTEEDREHRADFEKNWQTMLDDLRGVVEG